MTYRQFVRWLKEYERFNDLELKRYWKKTNTRVIIPNGFDEELLKHYLAYKNEVRTRQLVWATLFMAGASIILSVVSLVMK